MAAERTDVSKLGSGWNKTLHNYALAMRQLDQFPITDQRSWKYLAAMHGFDRDLWVQAGVLKHNDPVPPSLTDGTFGDQCQHGTWYFLPWHRGYLFAFEAIVAKTVRDLTGDDWALPYWNYLDASRADARNIPDAFDAQTLPDGSPNPFLRYPRNISIKLPNWPAHRDISLVSMKEADFLVGANGSIGFGGGKTNFEHFGGVSGDLEVNPHNRVHTMIGGFMGDPAFAGLDPLFWLHHCNIDRLWEAWMATPGKTLSRDVQWLDGPTDRTFMMPGPGAGDPAIEFTARETLKGGKLHRGYDDLTAGTGVTPGGAVMAHVSMGAPEQQKVELLGANEDMLTVGAAPAHTMIEIEGQATKAAVAAMGPAVAGAKIARLYLRMEAIRGSSPSAVLDVYVNLPAGSTPEDHPDRVAGSLNLFGLGRASQPDGGHGGNGLGQTLDITDLAERLSKGGVFDPEHLHVTLVPVEGSSPDEPITIDRVSVLKRTGIATPE